MKLRIVLLLLATAALNAETATQTTPADEAVQEEVIEEVQKEPIPHGLAGKGASPQKTPPARTWLRSCGVFVGTVIVTIIALNLVSHNPGMPAQ